MTSHRASDPASLWCILTTSSGRTLSLARSLNAAGFEAWSPVKTIRRPAPGQRRRLALGLRRKMIEVDSAILPGFVFARGDRLEDLALASVDPALPHQAFDVFLFAGHVPMISDASIAGLREEEERAAAFAQSLRDADSRAEAQRIRAEFMRTEAQRRAALRRERRDFAIGEEVTVIDMPSMAGLVGKVEQSTGTRAKVHFGGSLTLEVEAWQVIPSALLGDQA